MVFAFATGVRPMHFTGYSECIAVPPYNHFLFENPDYDSIPAACNIDGDAAVHNVCLKAFETNRCVFDLYGLKNQSFKSMHDPASEQFEVLCVRFDDDEVHMRRGECAHNKFIPS
jgi:hypothetical protein